MSCDLLPTEVPGNHYQGPVEDVLNDGWDLMIGHPPCQHLSVSGARWWKDKQKEQAAALDFVRLLLNAPIPKIVLENPVSKIATAIRKPNQIIQPWMFGHGETKATCLWFVGDVQPLVPTYRTWEDFKLHHGLQKNAKPEAKVHLMSPGPNRWRERSRTYQGIADAMARQWG